MLWHLNISRASVVKFLASRYIMRLNRTSEWKVITIRISRELPLFNFECLVILCAWIGNSSEKLRPFWTSPELPLFNFNRLDILCTWIGPPSEKLWPFELLKSFHSLISSVLKYYAPESDLWVKSYDHLNFSRACIVQFRASRYVMRLNWTSELNVMTIRISRELPFFNFERLDILCAWIRPPSERLIPLEFLESFRFSISSVSLYYAPESEIRVKSYDHLNFSSASVAQFRASRYIMRLNRTSSFKFMTIWISRELPLFNFERLYMWCAWIGHLR